MSKLRIGLIMTFLALIPVACTTSGADENVPPTGIPTESPTTAVEPTAITLPTEVGFGPYQLVHIGGDGNVWFRPGPDAPPQQITSDAKSSISSGEPVPSITYYFPAISDDAEWVAVRRDAATPLETRLDLKVELWIHSITTGESRLILEQTPAGFSWKPGTHLMTYGVGVAEGYFTTRGGPPDATLAHGIMTYNADSGETAELVQPERGYALYSPQWSPDGRFLGFDELAYMEGRGSFAYYDFEAGMYIAWEESIGNYSWSPDGSQIYYDRLTYVYSGAEEIFRRTMPDGSEERLTNYAEEIDFAFLPAPSPNGDRIAFFAGLDGQENQTFHLMILNLSDGEPQSLGTFDNAYYLTWSPDGKWLLFSAGPWEAQNLLAVNSEDGAVWNSGPGTSPSVAGGLF